MTIEPVLLLGYGVARIFAAAVFLYSGVDKLWHFRACVAEVEGLGLRRSTLFAILTILTQIVGGLLVITGYAVWFGALLLAGFTVVATLLAHRFWAVSGPAMGRELTTALEHLAIVGGLLLIAIFDLVPRS